MTQLNNELIAVIEDWVKAYEGEDAERVIDLYTADAVIAVQGRATVSGGTAIAELLRASLVKYDRRVTVRFDRAEREASWGYVYGRSWITLTPRDGSAPTNLFGRFIVVLRHCDDGKWRIFMDFDQPSADVEPTKPHFGS